MTNYRNATIKLCDRFEDLVVDGELRIPEQSFADAVMYQFPGLSWETGEGFVSRYVISEPVSTMLIKLAREDYRFYDHCVEISVCNIDSGAYLPAALRHFSIEVLRGDWRRPKTRGSERKKTWLRDEFLFSSANHVERVFGLPLTRNDVSSPTSACDAVSEALRFCGNDTSYAFVKDLCTHSDKANFRKESKTLKLLRNDYRGFEPTESSLDSEFDWQLSNLVHSAEGRIRSALKTDKRSRSQKGDS